MATIEDHRAAVRRLYETMSGGDAAAVDRMIDELTHPELDLHTPLPSDASGREKLKQGEAALRRAFPDLRLDVQEVIAEGDKAVVRVAVTGTHEGEHMGLPPTGKPFAIDEIMIFRFDADGRIVAVRGLVDVFSQMQQLGVIPAAA